MKHITTAYLIGIGGEKAIPPGFTPLSETCKAPLWGRIACGQPSTAGESMKLAVPKGRLVAFSLPREGGSMTDAGTDSRDAVCIRRQPDIANGQIAAVRIDDEATLNRVYKHLNRLVLRPENRSCLLRIGKHNMSMTFFCFRVKRKSFCGKTLEIKRGIKTGPVLEEVCEAYAGMITAVSTGKQALEVNGEIAGNISAGYFYQITEKPNMGQEFYLMSHAHQIDGAFSEEKLSSVAFGGNCSEST